MTFCFSGVAAAGYPEKPIKLIVGFKAGGGTDTMARIAAEVISKDLGTPVVVINKPGGGGNVMCSSLVREDADGYHLGITPSTPMAFNSIRGKGRKWDLKDFDYLGTGVKYQEAFVTKKDAPYNTMKEAIAWAKKNNEKLRFSSVTPIDAAIGRALTKMTGVILMGVPTKGGAASISQVLGGHVDFGFSAAPHYTYVKADRMKILASLQEDRPAAFPNTTTLQEQGYDLHYSSYLTFFAPKGLPKEVKSRLEKAVKTAFNSEKFRAVVDKLNLVSIYKNADQSEELMRSSKTNLMNIMKKAK
jgi:tripartite-type tricarboxylate transporter receptor subunit TctC